MTGGERLPAVAGEVLILATPAGPTVETTVRVRFAETDAMGVVYHTNYIIWFEVGRGAYWRAMCQGAGGEPHDAGAFPVSVVEARFHAPARYGDAVTIRTWVKELRSRSVTFAYECVLAADGRRLASGRTTHLFLDGEGRARRLPEAVREALLAASMESEEQPVVSDG